ncbi:multicopper oxidase [Hebeloma cylindrosporum]|uniref:Multicopper oxidase n=1 Tax=Hebeloma cylindrosporum TaxID=76867 RepID=A0A0C3BSH9_HEBCY|nr:multicopper oxidase [Hebeloma cylindrosporum h7]
MDLSPFGQDKMPPGLPWPGGTDVVLSIFREFDVSSSRYKMNGVSWTPSSIPVLLQILSGARFGQELLPKGSIYPLSPNKVIELSLPGRGQGSAYFSVVRSAGSDVYNFESPVRSDTVNTGVGKGNITIRFLTDNAGPWFLHCHIDIHLQLYVLYSRPRLFSADNSLSDTSTHQWPRPGFR